MGGCSAVAAREVAAKLRLRVKMLSPAEADVPRSAAAGGGMEAVTAPQ